jgi:hypothetical protein
MDAEDSLAYDASTAVHVMDTGFENGAGQFVFEIAKSVYAFADTSHRVLCSVSVVGTYVVVPAILTRNHFQVPDGGSATGFTSLSRTNGPSMYALEIRGWLDVAVIVVVE